MTKHVGTATYSPEDNKLRLYPFARLSAGTYALVKDAGFRWAPKQELFVAPAWTPGREDLLIDLCGEIDDEDTSLVDRAEQRAERFEDFSSKRARDAHQAKAAIDRICDGIPFGQPILVGHHSEKRARKDAERIQNGMTRAVGLWQTSKYWAARAQGAIDHAKYKELPGVRHRRIKGLQSDLRKAEKAISEAAAAISAWSEPGLTREKAMRIANYDHISKCFLLAEYPRELPASQYEGAMSLWSALDEGVCTCEQAREIALRVHQRTMERQTRWADHYENRLTYERAMLEESGGISASKFDLQVGGMVLNHHGDWSVILRLNKANGAVNSVSTNNKSWPRVVSVEKIRDYRPPTERTATAAKAATKINPLCNYPGEGFTHISQAQWDKKHKDYKGSRRVEATATAGAHRVRYGLFSESNPEKRGMGMNYAKVFITDAKIKLPPAAELEAEPVPQLPPVTKDLATLERENARRAKRQAENEPTEFDAMAESLRRGGAVQVVSAPQLFPTPLALAAKMVSFAGLAAGHRVLEPSAGTGNLIRATQDDYRDSLNVTMVELNHALAESLRTWFKSADVRCSDFLETGEELGKFDRVLMNPPFENAVDIKHVKHAMTMLKPGGRLVALCANGPRQREQLMDLATHWEDLPAGTFAASGTMVNVALLVIDAAEAAPEPLSTASTAAEKEGDQPFQLANEAPKRNPARFEASERCRQQDLFLGLHDLPGQTYLIPESNA